MEAATFDLSEQVSKEAVLTSMHVYLHTSLINFTSRLFKKRIVDKNFHLFLYHHL